MSALVSGTLWQVLGQAPGGESMLTWSIRTLGLNGLLVLLLSAVVFAGACWVVRHSRRPAPIAAYLVFLPLPLCFAFFGELKGSVASLSVMSMTGEVPNSADLSQGIAATLLSLLVALVVSCPSYAVVAFGLLARTMRAEQTAAV